MNKHIIAKTDASVNPNKGVALGYEATIYNNDGTHEELTGSHYIPEQMKTTKAEYLASTFAVKEIYEEIQEDSSDYRLIVETDCEKTVRLYNHEPNRSRLHRTLDVLTKMFDSTTIRWISRSNNTRADAIARSKLEMGWEKQRQ